MQLTALLSRVVVATCLQPRCEESRARSVVFLLRGRHDVPLLQPERDQPGNLPDVPLRLLVGAPLLLLLIWTPLPLVVAILPQRHATALPPPGFDWPVQAPFGE